MASVSDLVAPESLCKDPANKCLYPSLLRFSPYRRSPMAKHMTICYLNTFTSAKVSRQLRLLFPIAYPSLRGRTLD